MRFAIGSAAMAWVKMSLSRVLVAAKLQPRAFFAGELGEFADGDTAALGKGCRRLGGRALRVEGVGDRRAAPLHLPVRLVFRQFFDPNGQPARRREAVDFAVRKARRVDAFDQVVGERQGQRRQRMRRQLLGAQLEQQVLRAHQATRC
jgi:hypothetical protein